MYDAILMDLDGTLIPMNQKEFEAEYFKALTIKLVSMGYDKKTLVDAIWAGTNAMFQNDGQRTNREVFWSTFSKAVGGKEDIEGAIDGFYRGEFDAVRRVIRGSGDSAGLVALLRKKNYRLVLATSPVFPRCAVETRMTWMGLAPSDFELITSYENSLFCKQSLGYYRSILDELGVLPQRCLMVGNNVQEDMCAAKLGMDTYLITDYVENPAGDDLGEYRSGSFEDFASFAQSLPAL